MEPLKLNADLLPCGMVTGAAVVICLPLVLMLPALGQWLGAVLALTPAAPLAFWWWQRKGRSLTLYSGRLEDRSRTFCRTIPYDGITAEYRPRTARSLRSGELSPHLPVLCLRRDGKCLLAVPRHLYTPQDIQRAAAFLREAGVPVRRLY